MNVLLLAPELEVSSEWFQTISAAVPGIYLVAQGELADAAIDVAIVDNPPPGILCNLSNLKIILSLSAGIDRLTADPTLPDVPIVRLVVPEMVALMREYICYQVLRIHRGFAAIEQLHREKRWDWLSAAKPAMSRRVLVMGLGRLGRASAEALRDLGFQVSGWCSSEKQLHGIQSSSGSDGLQQVLPQTDILISVLPLTSLTRHLLSADLFRRLRKGASVINVGRGGCLNELDLVAALDSGQLSHATLDVFTVEPLPAGHPLWSHPKITITPHTAAYPPPDSFIAPIILNLQLLLRGEMPTSKEYQYKGY